jgi:signal transduction histidine kinase
MDDLHLDIDPRVVFDLGESLISDETTALVELIKNSYDADASVVDVAISSEGRPPEASRFPQSRGVIVVSDDGTGMDEEEIRRGWLIVARSPKRDAKERGETTPLFARVPLGDKGLGRLGAQRLGEVIELFTSKSVIDHSHTQGDARPQLIPQGGRHYVAIDWRDFENKTALSEIPVVHDVLPGSERGTRLIITGLRDPAAWSSDLLPQLQQRLGQFISPFREVASFRVRGSLNGEPFDLVDVSESLLALANQRVTFSYASGTLAIDLDFRPTFVRGPKDEEVWARLIAADDGAAFRRYLVEKGGVGGAALIRDPAEGWFLRTSLEQEADRLAELNRDGRAVVDPGPFHGEIHSFDLGPQGRREAQLSDYNRLVRSLSGIRIYRDGFAVRPYGLEGDDWLKLGSQWTSGGSYYGLKPANTIGFVAISAGANSQLREKTDREGFTDSPASRNFMQLMRRVVTVANDRNETIRRAYLDFVQQHRVKEAAVSKPQDPAEAFAEVRRVAGDARALQASTAPLSASVAAAREWVRTAESESKNHDTTARAAALGRVVSDADTLLAAIETHATRLERLSLAADIAERDLDRVTEQVDDFAELAALGLTVESVAHELRNVSDSLRNRTRDFARHMAQMKPADPAVEGYLEYVRSALSTVRKQLSHLSPALRFVREERQTFSLRDFLGDFVEFHQERLGRRSIRLVVDEPFVDTSLRMNRGRLTQVLDNLIQNAEYWLAEDLAAQRIETAEIHINGLDGRLRIWDNGRGFDPAIEASVFEPFVTNKPAGKGRGLGLFIVRQLLRAAGATIELLPDRNAHGSRYILEVEFGGAQIAAGA